MTKSECWSDQHHSNRYPPRQTANRNSQSRTQSPQALWPAVCRQKRLWGTGISIPQEFCGETMQDVTGAVNKKNKIYFSYFPRVLRLFGQRLVTRRDWRPTIGQRAWGLEYSVYEIEKKPKKAPVLAGHTAECSWKVERTWDVRNL